MKEGSHDRSPTISKHRCRASRGHIFCRKFILAVQYCCRIGLRVCFDFPILAYRTSTTHKSRRSSSHRSPRYTMQTPERKITSVGSCVGHGRPSIATLCTAASVVPVLGSMYMKTVHGPLHWGHRASDNRPEKSLSGSKLACGEDIAARNCGSSNPLCSVSRVCARL